LSCYGGQICLTPALDQLASEAIVFERAYTPLAVCSPARASIITGLYPHNHGVISNDSKMFNGTLKDDASLLSRRLEILGYDRWYNGKWHLGDKVHLPKDVGLPGLQFPGHGGGGYNYPEYKAYLREKGLRHGFSNGPHKLGGNHYGTLEGPEEAEMSAFLADDAISYLESWNQKPDHPFFLWVNFWGPHEPYYATEEYMDLYRNVQIDPWPSFEEDQSNKPRVHRLKVPHESKGKGWSFWEPAIRHYYAFMSLIDHQIGRILGKLDELGLKDDTVVIFAADHGESLGAHGGCQDKGHFMYEEIYRIPMMIRAPFAAPRRDASLVSLLDLCPTVLELAGESNPAAGRDGLSLLNHLHGEAAADWRSAYVAEFHGLVTPFTQRMIVNERYKYVWNMGDIDELYDLLEDPHEMNNLIDDAALSQHRTRLQHDLLQWMKDTKDNVSSYYYRHLHNQEIVSD
jgi:arylsulfatase A-like enzyme